MRLYLTIAVVLAPIYILLLAGLFAGMRQPSKLFSMIMSKTPAMVYVKEAHASDLWQMESTVKDDVVLASSKGYEEQANLADTYTVKLGVEFPALVDDFENLDGCRLRELA